jgi:hypothetical protein
MIPTAILSIVLALVFEFVLDWTVAAVLMIGLAVSCLIIERVIAVLDDETAKGEE